MTPVYNKTLFLHLLLILTLTLTLNMKMNAQFLQGYYQHQS